MVQSFAPRPGRTRRTHALVRTSHAHFGWWCVVDGDAGHVAVVPRFLLVMPLGLSPAHNFGCRPIRRSARPTSRQI